VALLEVEVAADLGQDRRCGVGPLVALERLAEDGEGLGWRCWEGWGVIKDRAGLTCALEPAGADGGARHGDPGHAALIAARDAMARGSRVRSMAGVEG
jgi:hypothetical protein